MTTPRMLWDLHYELPSQSYNSGGQLYIMHVDGAMQQSVDQSAKVIPRQSFVFLKLEKMQFILGKVFKR